MKKSRNRYKSAFKAFVVIALIVILYQIRFTDEVEIDKSPLDRFVIVRVIDGDTIELKGGDKLRLLAVDTPEKGEPYYKEAKQFLEELTLGKVAEIKYSLRRRDKYGRLLGYLFVDGRFVNKEIIENGLGYLYLFKDNDLSSSEIKIMLNSQRDALQKKQGIWSIKHADEDYYLNPQGSFRLHRPGCKSIQRSDKNKMQKFSERFDGFIQGLSPCRNCKP